MTKPDKGIRILTLSGLAKEMAISRQQLFSYVDRGRIRPDYVDESSVKYWKLTSAERLKKLMEEQRALPPRVRRKFE